MPRKRRSEALKWLAEEVTRAKADPDNQRIGCSRGPATGAEIEQSHQVVNAALAENEAKHYLGSLSEEGAAAPGQCSENSAQLIPETRAQLLANQPRLIESLDGLLELKKLCDDAAQNGEITLTVVRKHLAHEIDGVLKYFAAGLGYRVRGGRPRASAESKSIRFKKEVAKALGDCRSLVRFALKNLDARDWNHLNPSVRRTRQEHRLKEAGYSCDQVRAYFEATASSHNKPAAGMTSDTLERIAEVVAVQLVAIREGLDDSLSVYRAYHQPAYPRRKKFHAVSENEAVQKLAEKLLEVRS